MWTKVGALWAPYAPPLIILLPLNPLLKACLVRPQRTPSPSSFAAPPRCILPHPPFCSLAVHPLRAPLYLVCRPALVILQVHGPRGSRVAAFPSGLSRCFLLLQVGWEPPFCLGWW